VACGGEDMLDSRRKLVAVARVPVLATRSRWFVFEDGDGDLQDLQGDV
jgi:hypothetical protein